MKFRTDFLVLPALVHAVEKGWLTLDEALSATNDPTGWTNENLRREQHLHLNALLYDRGVLPESMWHELQPAVVKYLQGCSWSAAQIPFFIPLLVQHVSTEHLLPVTELLLTNGTSNSASIFQLLTSRLTEEHWQTIWQVVQSLPDQYDQNQHYDALQLIAPFTPDTLVSPLFDVIINMPQPALRVWAAVIPRLNHEQLQQILPYIDNTGSADTCLFLKPLLPRLSHPTRQQILQTVLLEIIHYPQILELQSIVSWLDETLFAKVLEAVLQFEMLDRRLTALLNLLPRMEEAEQQYFIAHILNELPKSFRGNVKTRQYIILKALTTHFRGMPPETWELAKKIMREHFSGFMALQSLVDLANLAPESLQRTYLLETIELISNWEVSERVTDMRQCYGFLAHLHLSDESILQQVFTAMMAKPAHFLNGKQAYAQIMGQAHALSEMFPRLNDDQIRRILARMQNVEEGA